MRRLGVFVCHCGHNIGATVNVARLIREIGEYPGVARCEDYKYMCSEPGQNLIRKSIKERDLDGVVIACCTPSLHEETFRRVAESAGLNRYLLEIANIREQCSWVHSDPVKATSKAATIIRTVIEKTRLNSILEPIKIPVKPKAMVIGGGIAGIQASLDIANSGYEVVLVERSPSIGGHMAQLSETFPTLDCSQCILTPKMVDVGLHENIKLHTYSEIEEISGHAGDFKAKIRKKPRSVDLEKCTGCGDCWNYCPVLNKPEVRIRASVKTRLEPAMRKTLDKIIDNGDVCRENIISILQGIMEEYNWLPRDGICYVAERLDIPVSHVYRIASFYTQFSLTPRGKHIIKVCLGTACFVRGAPKIISQIESDLGIGPGETTEDGLFTLETVNCLGACALGPLMVVDENYHGRMKTKDTGTVLDSYR